MNKNLHFDANARRYSQTGKNELVVGIDVFTWVDWIWNGMMMRKKRLFLEQICIVLMYL